MPFLVYCWSSCSFTFFTSFYILLDIMTQYTNTVSSFLFYFILYRQIECYRRTTNKKGGTHRVDIQSAPQVAQKGGEKKVIMQPILYPKEKSETPPHLPSPEGKLLRKLSLNANSDCSTLSKVFLFLFFQKDQNNHEGASSHIYLHLLPTNLPCHLGNSSSTALGKSHLRLKWKNNTGQSPPTLTMNEDVNGCFHLFNIRHLFNRDQPLVIRGSIVRIFSC